MNVDKPHNVETSEKVQRQIRELMNQDVEEPKSKQRFFRPWIPLSNSEADKLGKLNEIERAEWYERLPFIEKLKRIQEAEKLL